MTVFYLHDTHTCIPIRLHTSTTTTGPRQKSPPQRHLLAVLTPYSDEYHPHIVEVGKRKRYSARLRNPSVAPFITGGQQTCDALVVFPERPRPRVVVVLPPFSLESYNIVNHKIIIFVRRVSRHYYEKYWVQRDGAAGAAFKLNAPRETHVLQLDGQLLSSECYLINNILYYI